jgi:uncharacterized membrane protein YfcA
MLEQTLLFLLVGLLGGLLAGWFGIGGGVLFVLVLTEYYALVGCTDIASSQLVQLVIANSIFAVMFSGWVGSIKQYQNKTFYPNIFIPLSMASLVSSQATTYILTHYIAFDKKYFVLLFSALLISISLYTLLDNKSTAEDSKNQKPFFFLILIGIFTGIIIASTGLGGGAVLVPFLCMFLKINYKKAVSISLGFMAIVATVTTLINIFKPISSVCLMQHNKYLGSINIWMLLPIIIGIIVSTPYGVLLNAKLNVRVSKFGFFVFILLVITRLCFTTFYTNH